ncbi:S1C family serine protease [Evansella cellulosilytica]|uniref:HtrA2 peptidase n=1 Tax=Evansella cellulosilytica (strain ATCC 21833 / DSM 2522 / FERM P-1141 / JCM 9156 / N-4) TaxID=649639 RepID=E6TZW2_EVAC2|nr:trypsin-like peptidase domain-containing protein [Evansella cellulosilytica]ADU32528.1 HtrA2 peptidase [Evansella cellulosilytica DSM 2522]
MGYYDGHYQSSRQANRQSARRIGLYSFFGAIMGALIVVFSIPVLSNYGFLPYDIAPKGATQTGSTTEEAQEVLSDVPTNTVNISMTSEVMEAVDKVSDAVVGVVNMRQSTSIFGAGGEGTGSGVIYKVEGDLAYVVTNHHVIEGANEIDVTLTNGARVSAEVVGSDELTDLAVLTIDAHEVSTVADFGNSEMLRAGEPAIAIGNPLSFEGSVTLGIISAIERSIPIDLSGNGQPDWEAEVLQTDAAINPGNSGGALLNINGEVIGINSMKIAQHSVEGIGFAIPSNIALPVIEDLEQFGEVRRPQIGVYLHSLQEIPSSYWKGALNLPEDIKGGIYIEDVIPDTPAAKAGIQAGDVIVELDGEKVKGANELRRYLYTEKKIGDTLTVGFYRQGEKQEVEITLDAQVS